MTMSDGKICRVELCTELFNAIIPTLFLCFLLIFACYPYISYVHVRVYDAIDDAYTFEMGRG